MLSAAFDIYSCTADCTGSLLQWKMSPVDNGCNELQVSMLSRKHCFHLPMMQEYEIVQILRQRRRTDSAWLEIHLVDHFNCFRVLLAKEEFLDERLKVKPGKNGIWQFEHIIYLTDELILLWNSGAAHRYVSIGISLFIRSSASLIT